MDFATFRALKPSDFSDAAAGYRNTSDMASAAKDRIEQQIAVAMREAYQGEAATAALRQLQELAQNFHYSQVECGLVGAALDGFAYDVEAAKKKLDAAVENADAEKLTVNSDGSFSYPSGGEEIDGRLPEGGTVIGMTGATAWAIGRQSANRDPNPYHRRAQDYADQIADALEEATAADEKWAPKLRALKADDDLTVSGSDWVDVKKDTGGVLKAAESYLDSVKEPPRQGSPRENGWQSLTDEQQADYIAVHPDSIGWMDGLPADVCDEANRTVLAQTRGAAKEPDRFKIVHQVDPNTGEEVDVSVRLPENEWKEWDAKRQEIQDRINGMDAQPSGESRSTSVLGVGLSLIPAASTMPSKHPPARAGRRTGQERTRTPRAVTSTMPGPPGLLRKKRQSGRCHECRRTSRARAGLCVMFRQAPAFPRSSPAMPRTCAWPRSHRRAPALYVSL
ncbi:hypothetical protein [Streptomyces sp. CAI-85]|uniref:hypothetical protein n=1 Tax=Streptomyces sp. CAI-85 TaxID=1472662 RepID=UPI0015879B50|nr:hypothetical protein [Streptomyces sp. CAI-85]NUV65182.1 hypothetical protein [Streptomyces sp. CAI-85]